MQVSIVRLIADLHFNHKNIAKWEGASRGGVTSMDEHNEWLIRNWNKKIKKRDLTWVLGDVAFDHEGIEMMKRLNGVKHLVMGNHDTFAIKRYLEVFNKVSGLIKYKRFWLSHAPIREGSLRGIPNIHGHTHSTQLLDGQYICVSVEAVNGVPIELETIRELYKNNIPLGGIEG